MAIELDIYDDYRPKAMKAYLAHYGWSFSKKAFEYAVEQMYKVNSAGKRERVEPISKEKTYEVLKKYNITLENDKGYNATYIMNMAHSDYYKSSITDEQHLAMFVKDYIDDPDNKGGQPFRKWYASEIGKGNPVDWEDLLD